MGASVCDRPTEHTHTLTHETSSICECEGGAMGMMNQLRKIDKARVQEDEKQCQDTARVYDGNYISLFSRLTFVARGFGSIRSFVRSFVASTHPHSALP